jgi:dUTP pyrophosphatase
MKLKIKKLDKGAKLPERAHVTDAGLDIFAGMSYNVRPGDRIQISTKIAMEIPIGYVGLVWDKSGLSQKKGLKTLGGVVDSGYRGEVMVGMINLSDRAYTIERGDKVAQMIIQKCEAPEIIEVDKLSEADRGSGAFGSTGK